MGSLKVFKNEAASARGNRRSEKEVGKGAMGNQEYETQG